MDNKGIISQDTPERLLASRQHNNNDAPLILVNEMVPTSRDPIRDPAPGPGPDPNLLGPPSYQSTITVVGDGETEAQRKEREERENMERNEMSLVRMLVRHNQNIGITGNMNVFKTSGHDLDPNNNNKKGSGGVIITPVGSFSNLSIAGSVSSVDEFSYTSSTNNLLRDDLRRTASMVSWGPGPCQKEIMSRRYKLVTSGVLWFCYYSLALNDYIFGPTFNDLSMILQVSFDKIAYFAVYRQLAYTLGSLGGLAFDYLNRQLLLIVLLLLSAASLLATPFVPNMTCFFLIAIINGFSAGACDVGFHVWILEMFQNGGGPLLQALHFSFGLGIATAPLISANFLSAEEGACSAPDVNSDDDGHTRGPNITTVHEHHQWTREDIATRRRELFIPYCITGVVVGLGGLILLGLYYYKKYIPPQERKLPASFDEQMPQQLTSGEKSLVWKRSLPSKYIISIICLGALMLWAYYGLEVTYFQFLAQFANAVPLPIHGTMSANLEAATGAAYALGGAIATWLSFRCYPENMIYVNFMLINIGSIILILFSQTSLVWFWIGNIVIGLGFSSCYATAYTFLEHHINVTNMIGSLFLFAGGAGTALFPILLADICSNPNLVIHLCLACANFALLLFMLMHFITKIRQRHVKLIQDRLLKNPAILLQIKQRTLSQLSYAPQ